MLILVCMAGFAGVSAHVARRVVKGVVSFSFTVQQRQALVAVKAVELWHGSVANPAETAGKHKIEGFLFSVALYAQSFPLRGIFLSFFFPVYALQL